MYECAACGFSFDLAAAESVGPAIMERGGVSVLALRSTPAAHVRTCPDAATWSPLEYGCHLRDVLLVQRRACAAGPPHRPSRARTDGTRERVEHDG